MAIWQYNLFMVPREELESYFDCRVLEITEVDFDNIKWWQKFNQKDELISYLSSIFPVIESWDSESTQLGILDSNCFFISADELSVRIDLRSDYLIFAERVIEFAKKYDLVFLNLTFKVIYPEPILLEENIKESKAYNFVKSPDTYLSNLSEEE
jgi:hypothetical protein